jgi:hypothetical protein
MRKIAGLAEASAFMRAARTDARRGSQEEPTQPWRANATPNQSPKVMPEDPNAKPAPSEPDHPDTTTPPRVVPGLTPPNETEVRPLRL